MVNGDTKTMANEFDEMYNSDDFNEEKPVESNNTTTDGAPASTDNLISGGDTSLQYDINQAPKTTRGPERENLDGKEVTIEKIEINLPKPETPWTTAKNNANVKYKSCQFLLHYDINGQREYYSGTKVFERVDNGVSKYSDPTIQDNATNQVSQLKKVYADFKGKKSEEVSLHEFLSFLNSKPKAIIKWTPFEFDGKVTNKNIVVKFI
jgi:hypothetical protein